MTVFVAPLEMGNGAGLLALFGVPLGMLEGVGVGLSTFSSTFCSALFEAPIMEDGEVRRTSRKKNMRGVKKCDGDKTDPAVNVMVKQKYAADQLQVE